VWVREAIGVLSSMKNIYIVGFMGTGKTSVGRKVAQGKNGKFVDMDELIEDREKRSIPDIFALEGEPYFRKNEKQVLEEISRNDCQVVSCGGGIVIDAQNIKTMKNTGIVICLTASPEAIFERTKRFSHRPLLNVPNPIEKIEDLLKTRAPYYGQADFTIDTSDLTLEQVVEKIMQRTAIEGGQVPD
jgi:shikimate kinase